MLVEVCTCAASQSSAVSPVKPSHAPCGTLSICWHSVRCDQASQAALSWCPVFTDIQMQELLCQVQPSELVHLCMYCTELSTGPVNLECTCAVKFPVQLYCEWLMHTRRVSQCFIVPHIVYCGTIACFESWHPGLAKERASRVRGTVSVVKSTQAMRKVNEQGGPKDTAHSPYDLSGHTNKVQPPKSAVDACIRSLCTAALRRALLAALVFRTSFMQSYSVGKQGQKSLRIPIVAVP